MKKIRIVESTVQRIEITPSPVERLSAADVAKALGAEPVGIQVPRELGPVPLYATRLELFQRLQSESRAKGPQSNGQPPQVPLTDEEWRKLEALATRIAVSTKLTPTPGQVARAILSLALRSVAADATENGSPEGVAALANELATHGTP